MGRRTAESPGTSWSRRVVPRLADVARVARVAAGASARRLLPRLVDLARGVAAVAVGAFRRLLPRLFGLGGWAGAVLRARGGRGTVAVAGVVTCAVLAGALTLGGDEDPAAPAGARSSDVPARSAGAARPAVDLDRPLELPVELPRGGREVFPRHRLVGYSGGPGTPAFGRLGIGDIDARGREIERLGHRYDGDGRTVLPVFELITVVALDRPGPGGLYRGYIEDDVIEDYLAAARRHRALLLLNVQPGRSSFLREVRRLEPWLRLPDVGLALDPEWAVGADQVPGRVFGSVTGEELRPVMRWVGDLVRRERLPEKVVVVHRLIPRVVRRPQGVGRHEGVAVVFSADGIGGREAKEDTWDRVVSDLPSSAHPGFKLFYDEDTRGGGRLMTPSQVLALRPRPEYVLYE